MNSNKGLEALAALASASSHRNNNDTNNSNAGNGSSSEGNHGSSSIDLQSIVNLTAALQQQQQQQQVTQNTINPQLLSHALSSGINPTAVATLLQGLNGTGMNFATNNNNTNNNNNSQFDLIHFLTNAGQALPGGNQFVPYQNQALQMLLSGRTAAGNAADDVSRSTKSQVLPRSSSQTSPNLLSSLSSNMPPPLPNNLQASMNSLPANEHDGSDDEPEGKKQMKRAANRKSAQLSRKRKKQFIEELKEENDGLRRKEQILRSIPDLVVVFDSSGKLWFVSESVERFLSFTASELEGTSFWDRLSPESVRILKAAFMDSLAAREEVSDTVQLGAGVWELELVDKSNVNKRVSLNGVVHFAGDRPECVCSIRPLDNPRVDDTTTIEAAKAPKRRKRGDATRISDSGNSSGESESDETDGR